MYDFHNLFPGNVFLPQFFNGVSLILPDVAGRKSVLSEI